MASLRRAQTAIRARGSIKCPHHEGKEVVFVCEDCDGELICTTCVSTIHKKHAVEEVSDLIPQIKVKMQDFINKTEKNLLPELREEMRNLNSKITKNKIHFKDVIGEIQEQNESLKQEFDKITNELIKMCQEIEDENNEILKNHKAELQLRTEELDARIHELKDTLQTGTDIQAYDTSREIPNDVTIPSLPSLQDTEFNPTSILIEELEHLVEQLTSESGRNQTQVESSVTPRQQYGNTKVLDLDTFDSDTCATLQYTTTKKTQASTTAPNYEIQSFKLFQKFTHKRDIYGIQSASENQAWVNAGDGVQLLNYTGKARKTMEMEVGISDFCVSPSTGDIWFCSQYDNSVSKVTGDHKSTLMFYTNSVPLSICISADGKILVAMAQQIVKYTHDGKILCESKKVKQVPVVRYPRRISRCPVTRNIAIADLDYKNRGGEDRAHVSILNEDLQLLCRYYGLEIESFCPWDVCYSDTGDIYLADYDTSIHQISGRGEFIKTVYTDSDQQAMYLCVQSNGKIWAVFDWTSVIILQK